MSKKSVLLFSHMSDPARITGAEKMLLFVAKELETRYDITMIVPQHGMLSNEAERASIRILVHDFPLVPYLRPPAADMDAQLRAFKRLDGYRELVGLLHVLQPDLVVANTILGALPAVAAKTIGIPAAWLITETLAPNAYRTDATWAIARDTDWIVGVSKTVLAPFTTAYMQVKKRLLYPSWHPEAFDPSAWAAYRERLRAAYGIRQHEVWVGFLSADLTPFKGVDHFVRMADRLMLGAPHAKFVVAGTPIDPDYLQECRRLAAAAHDPKRIQFLPFTSAIESFYPALDLLVVPSLVEEGFALTALEGMLFGKPVVAYASGGLNEVLGMTGNAGLLARPGDVEELACLTAGLIADPQARAAAGARNLEASSRVFGIASFRSRLNEWLREADAAMDAMARYDAASARPYPDGSVLEGAESGGIFWIEDGVKRPIANLESLQAYTSGPHPLQKIHDSLLRLYPTGPTAPAGMVAEEAADVPVAPPEARRAADPPPAEPALPEAAPIEAAAPAARKKHRRRRRVRGARKGRGRAGRRGGKRRSGRGRRRGT
ncbi:glycosyltransferase, partial [Paenibacillus sp. IB182496]